MVRRYQHGDHLAIGRIYHEAIHRLASRHYSIEQLDAWAGTKADPDQWTRDWQARCERKQPFVKVLDDKVVGFIELDPDGHIDCSFVNPDHAGQGIMDEIMTRVKQHATSQGITRLFAEVSLTARKFFERQGFVRVRENIATINGVNLPNLIMEWTPVPIRIRPAVVTDASAIASLLGDLGYPSHEESTTIRIESLSRRDDHAIFIAEFDGVIAGFVAFHIIPLVHMDGGLGRITALSVNPAFQRKGVGRQLLAAAESFGWSRGCVRIEVTSGDSRADAHVFYQEVGYREDIRRFIKLPPE